ncbi:chaplin family protein [Pseudarthrobacter chlorophenolicus]|uniref:chaplin family protein n=1 Tax=Pseudarthrobacter chlorophenolicus TaxID=85085 RepID=UPI0005F29962|nr:chaplin family protein [Pseudarthrobacter chlorophenolicus]
MMHRNIRRCLLGTAVAGGLLAFGGVAANAADNTTSGTDGLLSGTQAVAPINIPVNLGATSLGLLGDSTAGTDNAPTGSPAAAASTAPASTAGNDGILSGTQVIAPVTVPVNLGATSVGLLGDSAASTTNAAPAPAPAAYTAPAASTGGDNGILSGTQVIAPVTVPITIGATSVGAVGDSAADTQGTGTAPAPAPSPAPAAATDGTDGIGSGTQVVAPITSPINLGATSVGAVGDSAASVEGAGTSSTPPAPAGQAPAATDGTDGILSGTQVIAPITAPINLGATSAGLIGDSAASVEGSDADNGNTTSPAGPASTSGTDGVLSGTQIVAPVTLPISLGATSVGLVGDSTATVVNPPVVAPPVVTPPVVTPPVVNPPVVTPPVVTPPVVNPPVVTPPVVTPPVVNPPAVTTPAVTTPGTVQPPAATTKNQAAAVVPVAATQSTVPTALANTGANTGLLLVGLGLLVFGGLVTLALRRFRA